MIQDLLLPSSRAEEFIEFVSKEFGFWPLWLCPFKPKKALALHPRLSHGDEKEDVERTFVNVGVWGPGSTSYPHFVEQNRILERQVRELGGIKWLYAQAYYAEDEFNEIYDREWYDKLREKYRATTLPTVFEKVRVDLRSSGIDTTTWTGWLCSKAWEVWPVSGLYGKCYPSGRVLNLANDIMCSGVWATLSHHEYLLAKK